METPIDPARTAYEAYAEEHKIDFTWEELEPKARDAWCAYLRGVNVPWIVGVSTPIGVK